MLKVIIDFLSSQENAILKAPVPFIVIFVIGLALGFFISSWLQKNKLETNEQILKLKEEKIQQKDDKIQSLEQQLKLCCPEKLKQNDKLTLKENEILALKAIRKFEKENPVEESQKLVEYSVDSLVKDLQINLVEANEILKNLRNRGLFESILDNTPQFANLSFINKTRPGRLSKTGREFLSNYSSGD
jgi:hypothetical protein